MSFNTGRSEVGEGKPPTSHVLAVNAARPANEPSRPDVLVGRAAMLAGASKGGAGLVSSVTLRRLFLHDGLSGKIFSLALRGSIR